MNIMDAMNSGKYFRRSCYNVYFYIMGGELYHCEKSKINRFNKDDSMHVSSDDEFFSLDDILADDWEVR